MKMTCGGPRNKSQIHQALHLGPYGGAGAAAIAPGGAIAKEFFI